MNWYKKAIKEDKCTGWIAVRFNKKESDNIISWGKNNIPDKEIYKEKGREDDIHITLKYGVCTENLEVIKSLLSSEKPVKAKLGKIGFFKPEKEHDVVIIKIDSPDLEKLNKKVDDSLNTITTFKYKPHCTIAYVKPGEAKKYSGNDYFNGKEVIFNKIVFKNYKDEEIVFSLKG